MPTISEQLTQLASDRDDLVTNLTTKGITGLTGDETFTELVPEVLNIPSGGGETPEAEDNDVIFIDYDGKRLYSYSASEFANLSAMPANPTHEGLTSQGWNWTLSDAQNYVAKYGMLVIGQLYVTTDGSTKLYVELTEDTLKPYVMIAVNGTVTVDWGDEETSTITGTSLTTLKWANHQYVQKGNYVVRIIPSNSTSKFQIYGDSSYGSKVFSVGQNNSLNRIYNTAVKKIEIGENCSLNTYAFSYMCNLETITCPVGTYVSNYDFQYCYNLKAFVSGDSYIGTGCFQYCFKTKYISLPKGISTVTLGNECLARIYGLKKIMLPENYSFGSSNSQFNVNNCLESVVIPDAITTIPSSLFNNCMCLNKVYISQSVTSIAAGAFNICPALTRVKMPAALTSIASGAFSQSYSIMLYDFSECLQIPTLGSNALTITTNGKIIVPDALYESWIADSSWSSYTSYIIKASEA